MRDKITLIGAGLAGPLMGVLLSKKGYSVDIYESRQDMRRFKLSAGRSINLALSSRGIAALNEVGIFNKIKPWLIPMSGRMIHDQKGRLNFQPYGQSVEEVIYSISRAKLNQELMSLAESTGQISIFFEHKLLGCDFENKILHFDRKEIKFNKVFGSDGSNSIIRDQIIHNTCASFIHKPLGHGYKELTMPTSLTGDFLLNSKSLHIWPRGDFMMIALPNPDKTFTLTLFMPLKGSTSFESLNNEDRIKQFFKTYFEDAYSMIPDLVEEYLENPVGKLASNYCSQWHFKDTAVIFGDAAHAIVPFFGQGMNASFQDCLVLNELIDKNRDNWEFIFKSFSLNHIKNGYAIADMALENYVEMRDSVNDESYLKIRELELKLEKKFPNRFVPRYSMVSFHQIPYSEVYRRGKIQFKLMSEFLSKDISKPKLYKKIESLLPILK